MKTCLRLAWLINLVALSSLGARGLQGQTRTITGTVRDRESSEVIPRAVISVKGMSRTTSSNVDGRFTLLGAPTDTVYLLVRALGFTPAERMIEPGTGETRIEVRMRASPVTLDEITVTAEVDRTVKTSPNLTGGPPAGGGGFTLDSIQINWVNPTGDWFFLAIESLDSDPEYILPSDFRGRGGFRLRLSPTTTAGQTLTFLMLEFLGHHRATLYHVNKEYADLYQNRTQDSRDLNEPPTNLTGGLGVFSAFSGRSADFTVQRQ